MKEIRWSREIIGVVLVFRDVSVQMRIEQELLKVGKQIRRCITPKIMVKIVIQFSLQS
jgi:hypothetical protein